MKIVRPMDGEIRPTTDQHSLFLVGPTPRELLVRGWRGEALDILSDLKYKGAVYVPEPFVGDYRQQIRWETLMLSCVNVIAAWVCRDMATLPALTTNIEFGEWFKDPKFVYGRPDGAPHTGYLDERYRYRDFTITGTSEDTDSAFGNKPHNTLLSLLTAATAGHCE